MKEGGNINITISWKTVALFTIIPLTFYFLWIVRDLLFSLLIAFILMSALRPGVLLLVSKKIPRSLAVGIVYLFFILFFLSLIWIIVPPIFIETANLLRSLPAITSKAFPYFSNTMDIRDISGYIPNFTNNIFGIISGLFSNTLFVLTTLFFGLYFLLEENLLDRLLHHYFKKHVAGRLSATFILAEKRMASWFWGEIVLMTVVGVFTYFGLLLLGIRYALPLAVLAGLLEVVPNIGPVLSSIPAIIIGFSQSYFGGFSAMALYVIVQQLENNLVVPVIMKKAVGLNPIMTLIVLLVGGRVGGVLGVLLAIPILLFAETIFREYSPTLPHNENKS